MSAARVQIKSFVGRELPLPDLHSLAILDNKVFCGNPWYEGVFCEECGAMKFPTVESNDAETCKICKNPAISVDLRTKKVSEELSNNLSFVVLAKNEDGELIGYAFGYEIDSPTDFVNDKYTTEETKSLVKIAIESFGIRGPFYYWSGTGIDYQYRGLGISNSLGKSIDDYARVLGLSGITRTLYDSPIVRVERKLGFEIIVGPNIFPLSDKENPKRVLLARR